jgi:hypothetical protein
MKRNALILICVLLHLASFAQQLNIKSRQPDALTGSAFAAAIADTALSLAERETIIFKAVKQGNIPNFLRKLSPVVIQKVINGINYELIIYVTPDYLSIGSNDNYFYTPTTPMLAQQIADLTHSLLPTKTMVDEIYRQAKIKLSPMPIPPSKAMTTVPVFIAHNAMLMKQLDSVAAMHAQSTLTAGNKKDIILSNKIYGENSPRVVIYGWHKLDGKPIQPVYNKHTNTWADYSHGVRLVSKIAVLNGKKVKLSNILKDPVLCQLVSNEGVIAKAKYPKE